MKGIVPNSRVVVLPAPEYGKLLLDVPVDGEYDGHRRHENVADERLDYVRESGSDAVGSGQSSSPRGSLRGCTHQTKGNLQNASLEGKVDEAIPHVPRVAPAPLEEGVGLGRGGFLVAR